MTGQDCRTLQAPSTDLQHLPSPFTLKHPCLGVCVCVCDFATCSLFYMLLPYEITWAGKVSWDSFEEWDYLTALATSVSLYMYKADTQLCRHTQDVSKHTSKRWKNTPKYSCFSLVHELQGKEREWLMRSYIPSSEGGFHEGIWLGGGGESERMRTDS